MSGVPAVPQRQRGALQSGDLLVVVLALVAAGLGFWLGLRWFGSPAASGQPAPELVLRDTSGREVRLSDFRGTPVLINFWATWCAPCVHEMPMLDEFARAQAGQLVVLGVAEDHAGAVTEFLKTRPVQYQVLQSPTAFVDVSTRFGNERSVLPYSVLVDADGAVRRTRAGMFREGELEQFVR